MRKTPRAALPLVKYFVDESGDGVLFGTMGRDRLKDEKAARYFMLGMVQCEDQGVIAEAFEKLRTQLLENPLYASIPSLDPKRGKTGIFFHAKDDHPEIRAKVFDLILTFDFKFFAVIKDLKKVGKYVEDRGKMDSNYRYTPNELYDFTVRMLFKKSLHKADEYQITFAKRGKSDRTLALRKQLEDTRSRFLGHTKSATSKIEINAAEPRDHAGLQLTDYCLWAVQRAFERFEVRFLHAIWSKVSLIHDADEGSKPYGLYLTRKNLPPTEIELRNR